MSEKDWIIMFLNVMSKQDGMSTRDIKSKLTYKREESQQINNLKSNHVLESRGLANFIDGKWHITELGTQLIELTNKIK